MKAVVGLLFTFFALVAFAHGQIGGGVLFGLIAWGVFASGSGGNGGGGTRYRYAGSTHHYERVG